MIEDKIYSIPIQPNKKRRKPRLKKESMVGVLLREIQRNTKAKIIISSSMIVLITSLLLTVHFGNTWKQDSNLYGNNIYINQLPQTGEREDDLIKYCVPDTNMGFNSLPNKYIFTTNENIIKIRYQHTSDFSASLYKSNETSIQEIVLNKYSLYQDLYNHVEYYKIPTIQTDVEIYEFQYDIIIDPDTNLTQHITNVYLMRFVEQEIYTLQAIFTNSYPQYPVELDTLSGILASLEISCASAPKSDHIQNSNADINISLDKNFWVNYNKTQEIIAIINKENYVTSSPIDFQLSWQDAGPNYDTSLLVDTIQEIGNNITLKPGKQNIDNTTFYFINTTTGRYYLGYVANIQKLISIEINYSQKDILTLNQLITNISFGTMPILPETGESIEPHNKYDFLQSQLATTRIFTYTCTDILIEEESYLTCTNQIGTGYLVNDNGFILTDTSIISPSKVDILINSILYGFDPNNLYDHYATDAIINLSKQDVSLDQISALNSHDYNQHINALIIQDIKTQVDEGTIDISDTQTNIYIQRDAPFQIDFVNLSLANSQEQYQAQKVSSNIANSIYIGSEETDIESNNSLALIKIIESANTSYPSIAFSTDIIDINTQLYVLEFNTNGNTILLANPSDVVANTPEDNSFHSVVTSIGPNSLVGAPIINEDNNLIGQLSQQSSKQTDINVNNLINIPDISAFLDEYNVLNNNDSKINDKISSAMTNINNQYYNLALNDLIYVQELSQFTSPIISEIIAELILKIDAGEDNSPLLQVFAYNLYQQELYISTSLITAILISLTILAKTLQYLKKKITHKDKHTRYIKKNHSIVLQTHMVGNPL